MKKNPFARRLAFSFRFSGSGPNAQTTKSFVQCRDSAARRYSPRLKSNLRREADRQRPSARREQSLAASRRVVRWWPDRRPRSDIAEPLAAGSRVLSPPQIQARIVEAERLLKSRPMQTANTSPAIDIVTLAALDRTDCSHSSGNTLQRQLLNQRL